MGIPIDPATKQPFERAQERIQELVDQLQRSRTKIILPWPAVAEFLILTHPDHIQYLEEFRAAPAFELSEFGHMAAIELTEISIRTGRPSKKDRNATYAKLKYDRQIVSIAVAKQCTAIYSTDDDVVKLAKLLGMSALNIKDLPDALPVQTKMFGGESAQKESGQTETD